MNQKFLAISAIVFIAWFSWFFRYNLGSHMIVLDRWTGSVIMSGDQRYDLSDAKTSDEKRAEAAAIADEPKKTGFLADFESSEATRAKVDASTAKVDNPYADLVKKNGIDPNVRKPNY